MASRPRPVVIVAFPVDPSIIEGLGEHYVVRYIPDPAQRQETVRTLGASVQAVITNGSYGWNAELDVAGHRASTAPGDSGPTAFVA